MMNNNTPFCRIATVLCAIVMFPPSVAWSRSYYVSATAAGAGSGTKEAPFGSIQDAADKVQPGDTVWVSGGTYEVSSLVPASSGTRSAFIVFCPEAGTGEVILRHPDTSPGTYTPVIDLSNKQYIRVSGFSFKGFKYFQSAISLNGATGCVVAGNRFEQLGHADVSEWNANSVIWMGNAVGNAVVDNYFADIIGDGVSINGQGCSSNFVGNNTFLRFTGKKRSWGGDYLFTRCIDIQDMTEGNNVIYANSFSDVPTCIWLDRDGSSNILLRNRAEACSDFIFNESRCASNIVMENIGAGLEGIAFQTAHYETGWTVDAQWTNNVAYQCKTGFLIHKSHRDRLRNNIVYDCSSYAIEFSDSALASGPHTLVDNIVFTPGRTATILQEGRGITLEEFQTLLGGTGNLASEPEFAGNDPYSENFTLSAESPAKGRGYGGVDLGAYAVYGPVSAGWHEPADDHPVQVMFDAYRVVLPRDGRVPVTVRLSEPCAETFSFTLRPVAGDAREDEDFLIETPSLVFEPGETEKTVYVSGRGMSAYDELVALTLDEPSADADVRCAMVVVKVKKTADAGSDSEYETDSETGYATVQLDASGTCDPAQNIKSYVWMLDGEQIATGMTAQTELPEGSYFITLKLTDADGNIYEDDVNVTVISPSSIWLEAEDGDVGSLWTVPVDANASGGKYVEVKNGYNSNNSVPAEDGWITYTFTVEKAGDYNFWVRTICPDPNGDSFWFKMDDNSFTQWNGIPLSTQWTWNKSNTVYTLSSGTHTFVVAYREDGTRLDRMLLTNSSVEPVGQGPQTGILSPDLSAEGSVYYDRASGSLVTEWNEEVYRVHVYRCDGTVCYVSGFLEGRCEVGISQLSTGTYIVRLENRNGKSCFKKILK